MTLDYAKAAESRGGRDEPSRRDSGPLRAGPWATSTAMWRWSPSRTVVVGSATVLFVVCCVLGPIGYLLFMASSGTDVAYAAVWLDARQRGLLVNTACLGTGTALLATAIGAPLGLALARIALPGRHCCGSCSPRPCCCRPTSWRSRGPTWGAVVGSSPRSPGAICSRSGPTACQRPSSSWDSSFTHCRCWRRKSRVAAWTDVSKKPRWSSRHPAECSGASRCRSWPGACSPPRWSSSCSPCPSSASRECCGCASTPPKSSRRSRPCTTSAAPSSWRSRC